MNDKPEYRIRVIIEDVNMGEEVTHATGAVYSHPTDTLATARGLVERFYNSKEKAEHEATHYPIETDE